jgi:hypothetical protein
VAPRWAIGEHSRRSNRPRSALAPPPAPTQ